MFLTVDSLINEEIPEPQKANIRDIKLDTLKVTQKEIDDTCFTVVRLSAEDFTGPVKKMPRLIMVNRDKYHPDMVRNLSTAVIVAVKNSNNNSKFITGATKECTRKIEMLLLDNYLVLPMFATQSKLFKVYGTDTVKGWCHNYGHLILSSFVPVNFFIFGEPYVWRYGGRNCGEFFDERILNGPCNDNCYAVGKYDIETAFA